MPSSACRRYCPSGPSGVAPGKSVRNWDPCDRAVGLGEAGTGGDAQGAGVADPFGTGTGAQPQTGTVVGAPSLAAEGTPGQVGEAAGQAARTEITTADQVNPAPAAGGCQDERSEIDRPPASLGPAAGAVNHAGAERGVEYPGGSPAVGRHPQDLLQVGATGLSGDGGGLGGSGTGPSAAANRPGEGSSPASDPGATGEAGGAGADGADPAAVTAAR